MRPDDCQYFRKPRWHWQRGFGKLYILDSGGFSDRGRQSARYGHLQTRGIASPHPGALALVVAVHHQRLRLRSRTTAPIMVVQSRASLRVRQPALRAHTDRCGGADLCCHTQLRCLRFDAHRKSTSNSNLDWTMRGGSVARTYNRDKPCMHSNYYSVDVRLKCGTVRKNGPSFASDASARVIPN